MNILSRVTWNAMWINKTRTVVTLIGVILSAALFTAVTTAAFSGLDFMLRTVIYDTGDYHLSYGCLSDDEVAALRKDPRVSELGDYQGYGYFSFWEGSLPLLLSAGDDTFYENMPVRLLEGRMPKNSGELLLPEGYADTFENIGHPAKLGDTITLKFTTLRENLPCDLHVQERQFTKTFTIVGYMEYQIDHFDGLWFPSLLTVLDEDSEAPMWHHVYVKCKNPADAYDMAQEAYGIGAALNSDLLYMTGNSRAANLNTVLWGIVAVLCGIIMVGSVSLIHNAFSISVTERTRQFGLLTSVGATKKQIRQSVFFEAGVISLMGIPLGLLLGWSAAAIVLTWSAPFIHSLFAASATGAVRLKVLVSPGALGLAGLIAVVTVYLSAWIPARRAARTVPLDAIRQTGDYQIKPGQARGGKLHYRIGGLPGMMAKKYYSVSRRKYRATVISLALSLILFLATTAVCFSLDRFADTQLNTESLDFEIYSGMDEEDLENVRALPGVEKSACVLDGEWFETVLTEDMYTDAMLDAWDNIFFRHQVFGSPEQSKISRTVRTLYVDDAVLQEYLTSHGIDPEPYFDRENPAMLVCNLNTKTPYLENEKGEWIQYSYQDLQVLRDEVTSIPLYSQDFPEELETTELEVYTNTEYSVTAKGELLLICKDQRAKDGSDGTTRFETVATRYYLTKIQDGEYVYYAYDPATKKAAAEPAARMEMTAANIRLGARVSEMPFGLPKGVTTSAAEFITLIGPLSLAPIRTVLGQPEQVVVPNLSIKVSDYDGVKLYLDMARVEYRDYLQEEQRNRGMSKVLNLFSSCFIGIISLICIANVFNTISTNIGLRRRDFGMLKSAGMKAGELRRMMVWECLIYGSKALLWGLSIGVVLDYLVYRLLNNAIVSHYTLPWLSMGIGAGCVLAVVFASMLYATRKLSLENPIDAIRMENI